MFLVWESNVDRKNPGLAPEGRSEISGRVHCAAHQCLSPRQKSGLLQDGNVSCRPDRCPAALGSDASSDRALTTYAVGSRLVL